MEDYLWKFSLLSYCLFGQLLKAFSSGKLTKKLKGKEKNVACVFITDRSLRLYNRK